MPAFDVKIKKMSLAMPFSQVADSFSKVGTIMYNVIQAETRHNETQRNRQPKSTYYYGITSRAIVAVTSLIVAVVPIATVKGMLKE